MISEEKIPDEVIIRRREVVFLILSGFFLGTLAVMNILGISRQLDFSFTIFHFKVPFIVFVGLLPYPVTFLVGDYISEIFGRKRANQVVWVGLALNIWVIFIMWLGGVLPPHPELGSDGLPLLGDSQRTFFQLREWAFGATIASMVAYLTAQLVDVYIFHRLKKLTKGKALWLRNKGSTLTSQFVDSIAVVSITFFFNRSALNIIPGTSTMHTLTILVLSTYVYKFVIAWLDTIPFYLGVNFLVRYLQIDNLAEYRDNKDDSAEIK